MFIKIYALEYNGLSLTLTNLYIPCFSCVFGRTDASLQFVTAHIDNHTATWVRKSIKLINLDVLEILVYLITFIMF